MKCLHNKSFFTYPLSEYTRAKWSTEVLKTETMTRCGPWEELRSVRGSRMISLALGLISWLSALLIPLELTPWYAGLLMITQGELIFVDFLIVCGWFAATLGFCRLVLLTMMMIMKIPLKTKKTGRYYFAVFCTVMVEKEFRKPALQKF